MKKVVNKHEVAHLFANQLQTEARTPNGSFYFYGDHINSYGSHFVIAKHVVNKEGENGLLFTERGYSNTTAGHIQIVKSACNHLNIISVCDPANSEEANFEAWKNKAEEIAKNLVKAKKPEIYINQISDIKERVNKYAQFFGLEIPKFLVDSLSITNKEEFLSYQASAEERAKEKQREEDKKTAKKVKEELKKFRAFKISTMYNRLKVDYLRYNKETDEIETSQAVKIKADICKRFYVNHVKTLKECKGCDIKLIDYKVKEINKKCIIIGCHTIELKEINKIAKLLNW